MCMGTLTAVEIHGALGSTWGLGLGQVGTCTWHAWAVLGGALNQRALSTVTFGGRLAVAVAVAVP